MVDRPGRLGVSAASSDARQRAAAAVEAVCRDLIAAAGPACVAVKPQLARFEALGAPGWQALEGVVAAAHEAGLLVVADGKRADVPVSAEAYADALLGSTETPWGTVPGLGADAVTLNPLLGADSLEPLVAAAAEVGAGIFVLVRTSNPGAADLLDLDAGGAPLHERIARSVDALADRLAGSGDFSGAGAVVGATEPQVPREAAGADAASDLPAARRRRPGGLRGAAQRRVRRPRLGARDRIAQRRVGPRSGRGGRAASRAGLGDRRRLNGVPARPDQSRTSGSA